MKTLVAHGATSTGLPVPTAVAGLLQAVAAAEGLSVERLVLDLAAARAEALGLDQLARAVRESEAE
ncbi:hypothetical protein P9279_21935 [Mesorhizobium sp. WSM4962]|uniref:hypothetical protein n=1 Tax=Mesorhizobium sp. WSM4962 TaxID=3038548 RepID=UPI00241746D2|nr:hypothetical protein [Mesorhizobium sp. WSM4962]MDG4903173.1 hypothetical protein [Mesorhizobium sp. WSM4962]